MGRRLAGSVCGILAVFVTALPGFAADRGLEAFIPGGTISRPFAGSHRGVDVAAPVGTPIHAPEDAVVLQATDLFRDQPLYGKAVVLEFDGGLQVWVTHLNAYSVKKGDHLSKGEAFATVGPAPVGKRPHVHIEAHLSVGGFEFRVDPASKFSFLWDGKTPIQTDAEEFYRSAQLVPYQSYGTDTIAEIYEGSWQHDPVDLSGLLFLPDGDGPFPVVVLQHGSGFPSGLDGWWRALVPELRKAGIGAFIADSYSGRALAQTPRNQALLPRAARAVDVFMALNALAKLPEVDPQRIGITGYSSGGRVAIDAADERIARALSGPHLRFAGHLPVYPSCTLLEDPLMTGAPVRFLLGEDDDYTPIGPCLKLAEELKGTGLDVSLRRFENAGHGFVRNRVTYIPTAQTARGCPVATVTKDGYLTVDGISDKEGGWASYFKAVMKHCGTRGVHLKGTAESRQRALDETVGFFKNVFENG